MDAGLDENLALGLAVVGVIIPVAAFIMEFGQPRKQEQRARERLRAMLFDELGLKSSNIEVRADGEPPSPPLRAEHARFALLLVEYYAYGLTRARRSAILSEGMSILGAAVLIMGAAIAIFRGGAAGQAYAAIVTTTSGALTTSLGLLFHNQANRALKHIADQTDLLRSDMKAERDAVVAVELLGKVADPELLARLQAALILRFTGADLPAVGHPSESAVYPPSDDAPAQ